MSLKWVDCDLPAPEERTPEQIRKRSSASFSRPPHRLFSHSRDFSIFHNQGGHMASDGIDGINLTVKLQHCARAGQENSRLERRDQYL
jgi:hypothetical protein